MANDKTYDRHINIWINGKEVKNDVSSIKKEFLNLNNELSRTTRGTDEYNQKAAEVRRVKAILDEHRKAVTNTGSAWDKVKGAFSSAQGIFLAGLGGLTAAYGSLKTIIFSTDALGDKFEKTIGGWKGGLDALARSLATINEGGLKNLGKNIKAGIEEGRRYAESLDNIDEKTRALKILESEAANELNEQRKIRNDVRKSLDERNEAATKVIQLEEKLAGLRTGIAQAGYENEAKNIASITHLTEQEVLAFAKQEESMVANIEAGKKLNEAKKKLTQYYSGEIQLAPEEFDKYLSQVEKATEETNRFAYAAANMPGDEKMQIFVDKYVNYQQAIGSVYDNLKDFSKQATLENDLQKQQEKDVADTTEQSAKKRIDSYDLLQAKLKETADELEKWYAKAKLPDTDKQVEEIRARQLEDFNNQYDINHDNLIAQFEDEKNINEIKRRNEIDAAQKTGASIDLINAKYNKIELSRERDLQAAKLELAAGFFGNIAALFGKQTAIGKAAAIAETLINTYKSATASYSALAKIPYVGPALGFAAAAAAVAAGLANVKRIIAVQIPEYAEGGYTDPGPKYAPRGVVHAGEWVANADMVASPQTGPIIQALENYRVNTPRGYANGGGPGISTTGSAGSAPAIGIGSDPELKALIRQNIRLNNKLLREGVKTVFGYREADNVRKGIANIEDVESDVSM